MQRRLGLPDATTLILEGLLFTNLLLWEALGGRIAAWKIRLTALNTAAGKGALQHG
ncbi:ABC transporter permease [Pseudomonas syringae pv. actinidiae ICMP 19070]|nr:ABC transporter permease [Pseudomonas syringae pv. actinidiae ICMP 19070]